MNISNTQIVCSALNIKPNAKLELAAEENCHCGFCGRDIEKLEPVDELKFGKSFIDQHSVTDATAPYICQHCIEITENSKFLMKFATGIFTQKGAFPVGKKIERAYWILNPPEPPFIFTIQQGKSQHMIWRAPINLSKKIIMVQLGNKTLSVNVEKLKKAASLVYELKDKYVTWKETPTDKVKKPKKVKRANLRPLSYSDIKANQTNMFEKGYWLKEMLRNEVISINDIQFLNELNWGESWFLDAVTSEDDFSQQPEQINL